MFSKKTLAYAAGPAKADAGPAPGAMLAEALKNPVVSVGGAACLFLLAAAAMILVAGDPRAGAPHVVFPLSPPGAPPPPPGWREALAPDRPDAPASQSALTLLPGAEGAPIQGQAVISFPGVGGAPAAADHSGQALPPAPIAGLSAPGPGGGQLPVIGPDGQTPAEAYARPFQSNGKPKIALVIGGLGLNAKATRQAIEQLPPEVTLSFVPYAEGLQGWIDLARANGHEVLLETPMEPKDYPDNDPGPYTLMAGDPPQATIGRLEWLLSRATGYFGLTNYLGSKFVATNKAMAAFMLGVRKHGLAFIDDGSAVSDSGDGAPRASADRVIDDQLAGDAIDQQLLGLEASALQNGQALGSGFAYPITLDEVNRWAQALPQRGYQLAPASALMMKR
ncbi:MAG: divergent polysaccharide deacetylase family protein [Caulobacteraceae bacterium]|nr:divergent polysaccharide deacetylase family protein [Caulobacteraceae bacterium]